MSELLSYGSNKFLPVIPSDLHSGCDSCLIFKPPLLDVKLHRPSTSAVFPTRTDQMGYPPHGASLGPSPGTPYRCLPPLPALSFFFISGRSCSFVHYSTTPVFQTPKCRFSSHDLFFSFRCYLLALSSVTPSFFPTGPHRTLAGFVAPSARRESGFWFSLGSSSFVLAFYLFDPVRSHLKSVTNLTPPHHPTTNAFQPPPPPPVHFPHRSFPVTPGRCDFWM